jgi:succinylarginine dihydrolase
MLDNSTQVQVNVPLQFAKFDNGIWIDIRTIEELNNIIVPEQVTAIQFIAQLSFEGINEQMILQVIEALPEPTKTIASASFKRAVFFERNSPFIPLIAQVFSKTKEQIDDIFIKANQL